MAVFAKDIARELGLSQAAVSLALRGRPGVSEATRAMILEKANELGYVIEDRASPSRRGMIQLVIYKRHGKVFSDTPFFEQLTEGVAEKAAELGYHLSISYFYGTQNHQEQMRSLHSLKSDGIILLATEMHATDMKLFSKVGVPLVVLDNFFPTEPFDLVGIDNRYGVMDAVRYLIGCGHTRLGYLHSSVDIRNFLRRQDGYNMGCRFLPEPMAKDAMRRVVRVGVTPEAAAADMRAYLSTDPILPTAFFADNDSIAAGCCRAIKEYGLRIPWDVSVIGFDDSSLCQMMDPPLTTMGVHKERMGALAVIRLHEKMQHKIPENVRILLRPRIVIRGTVLDLNAPITEEELQNLS